MRLSFIALVLGAFSVNGLAAFAVHFGRLDVQSGAWIEGFSVAVMVFSSRILPRPVT